MQSNGPVSRSGEQPGILQVQWWFRIAIAVCALVDCWICRFQMNPDGVAYLDMGDLYWKGDWQAALNPCWSPLYSWLTGLMFLLTQPGMRWEYPEVHLLNFAILMAALLCFEFFWGELLAARGEGAWSRVPRLHAWALGYLLFACIHFRAGALAVVVPDVLVSAIVYLASGMMLRFAGGRLQSASAWVLGIVLGLGYLAKAAMFPFAVIFMMTMLALAMKQHGRKRLIGATLLGFLAVALPFVAALSLNEHRFTWGDSAKFNQGWWVNHAGPSYRHWQGDGPGHSNPLHPSRKLLAWPEVYEFGTPIAGTYPVAYGLTYWSVGIDSSIYPLREVKALWVNLRLMGNYLFGILGVLTAVMLMMFLATDRIKESCRRLFKFWPIMVPATAVILMYEMVHWEERYTVSLVVVVYGAVMASSCRLEDEWNLERLRAANIVLAGLIVCWILPILMVTYSYHDGVQAAQQVVVAERLRAIGLEPGDRIAIIGDGYIEEYWARLDKVKIIAEVPHDPHSQLPDSSAAFWHSTPKGEEEILNILKNTGAKAVITDSAPVALPPGWIPVGNTRHAVYLFR